MEKALYDIIVKVKGGNNEYTEELKKKLLDYMSMILEYNEHINMTAITDRDAFILRHLVDSLTCAELPEFISASSVIDVGTGGGFPGLVLAAVFPEKKFVLLDSLGKRLRVLDEICDRLGIENVETLHGRAEDAAHNKAYREQFDFVTARAVARLNVLAEYCIPFVRVGGCFAAMKAGNMDDEYKESFKAAKLLGSNSSDIREVSILKYGLDHKIVIYNKQKSTPGKYPRKAGTPVREPII